MSLGLAYSAFVAPAPLLLAAGLGLGALADRTHLTRAASAGWRRGAHAAAQYRVSAAAGGWAGLALFVHLALTANGLGGWPHDGLCPSGDPDAPGQPLVASRAAVARAGLGWEPVHNPQVRRRCGGTRTAPPEIPRGSPVLKLNKTAPAKGI